MTGSPSIKRILLIAVMFAPMAHAGVAGWLTSEARDWQFIQKSGGVKIGAPLEKSGRTVLPVGYWPEGNSGLAVRKVELKRSGSQIVIRIYTQVAEKGSDTGRVHYGDLAGIPAGRYAVYYETAGDSAKRLGEIVIK